MNRNLIVIIFVVIVFGGIAAFVSYTNQFRSEYEWEEYHDKKSEEPYGLNLFYNLLDNQNSELIPITKDFFQVIDTNEVNSNYVIFGDYLYMDSLKAMHILKFVENGNNALFATKEVPISLFKTLIPKSDTVDTYSYFNESLITVDFTKSAVPYPEKLKFHYQYLKDTVGNYWRAYSSSYFNDTLQQYGVRALSSLNDDYINSFYIKYGKGKIVFYTNPILFSNYNIIQKDGFKNANNVLSQMNDGSIYWDETNKYSFFDSGDQSRGNPLQFLFSDYRLRWAWYLFLVTVLFYLLFRSKREQRIIPILPKNTNTSIEYIKAIGVLYFQKGKHKIIADEMYILFMADLRSRYHFSTQLEEAELIDQVITRTEIKREKVEKLFNSFRKVRFSPIANSKDLMELHQLIEFYHKNSK